MCVLWGTTYLAIRVGVATWEPFLFGGLRFAAAGTLVILALRLRNVRVPYDVGVLRDAAITGTLLLVGGNAAVILAARHVPSGLTAVMVSTMPIWTVVIASLTRRGHRLGPLNWMGLIAGLAGVTLLVWPSLTITRGPDREFLWGVVVLQLGSLSWAAGSVYASGRRMAVHPLLGAGLQMLAGGVAMILIGTLLCEW
ncbi:MAG: EamA family transporter, partial [Gemmatimonadota bacterium]|nr:EamA family transporter [Gemmatimonadota bacterium]